jgi:hypothetical protein
MSAPADRIDYGVVQQLPGMGPEIGSVWRNRHSGCLYTIVGVQQRLRCWVTVRGVDGEREISLSEFDRSYMPTAREVCILGLCRE